MPAPTVADAIAAGQNIFLGGKGNDTLHGTSGNDYMKGSIGNDTIVASTGNDVYIGGVGSNTIDYSQLDGILSVNLPQHTSVLNTGAATYVSYVSGFETIIGTTSGIDSIVGGHENDTFISAGANNTFFGGQGADTMVGGAGTDTFVITKHDIADLSVKTFVNFTVGQDNVDLSSFTRGAVDPNAMVKFQDVANADGSHSTMVQALVHNHWANVVNLVGVNANDVGADHHALTLADLHVASTANLLS